MSLTSGFFNSINHDRTYNAEQMAMIFDGIVNDGVYQAIGNALRVTAAGGNVLHVDTGRAWFNHTWTYNDAILVLTADDPHAVLDRIDAVVLEVNASSSVRSNSISIISGTSASTPVKPSMSTTDETIHRYPLCYIYRKAGTSGITQANITNTIGTSECPYVTGPLSMISSDSIVAQWEAEFNDWFAVMQLKNTSDLEKLKTQFDTWFSDLQETLGENEAANLNAKINTVTAEVSSLSKKVSSFETTVGDLPTIHYGTADPDNSVGKDGDIYMKLLT